MAEYRNIVAFRPRGGEKPFALQIGSAKMNDDGTIDLYFDALPLPTKNKSGDIQVHARISLPRENTARPGSARPAARSATRATTSDPLDDEVPW